MSSKQRLHNLRTQGMILHTLRSGRDRGYAEVHTPIAVPSAALEEIKLSRLPIILFLHTSPEFTRKGGWLMECAGFIKLPIVSEERKTSCNGI